MISVHGAQKLCIADSYDSTIVIKHYIKEYLKYSKDIKACNNTETLFNEIIINLSTPENRLMIYVNA